MEIDKYSDNKNTLKIKTLNIYFQILGKRKNKQGIGKFSLY